MKIVLVINDMSVGGAQRVVSSLANYYLAIGNEVTVVTLQNLEVRYPLDKKIKQITLRSSILCKSFGKILFLPVFARELKKIIDIENPDKTLSFLVRSNLVHTLSKFFGNSKAINLSERTISSLYYGGGLKASIMKTLIKTLYPKADNILAISEGVKESLCSMHIDVSKINVVFNPVDIGAITLLRSASIRGPIPTGKIIVTACRLEEEKDLFTLIDAFKLVIESLPASLLIIGDGSLKNQLVEYSGQQGLSDLICWLGWQDNPFSYIYRSDVFVMSSKSEAFGNSLVEAMVCGVPVISSDCLSGPSEILDAGSYGLLFKVGDAPMLAKHIIEVLKKSEVYSTYSKKSEERARDFSIDVIAKKYLSKIS